MCIHACVVVHFIRGSNFIFLLLLGIAMHDNEFETKENKIEPQHIHHFFIFSRSRSEVPDNFNILEFSYKINFFSVVTVKFLEPKCFKVDYHINCGEQGFPALRKAVTT